ncbi:hypothetical protein LSAT2_015782 [Lamellibrachia satsuma]|nr:hypothetical protein LSAT2_015782 [Lamellibrachia satsuma]
MERLSPRSFLPHPTLRKQNLRLTRSQQDPFHDHLRTDVQATGTQTTNKSITMKSWVIGVVFATALLMISCYGSKRTPNHLYRRCRRQAGFPVRDKRFVPRRTGPMCRRRTSRVSYEDRGDEKSADEDRGDEKSAEEDSAARDEKSADEDSGDEKSADEDSGDEKSAEEDSKEEKSADENSRAFLIQRRLPSCGTELESPSRVADHNCKRYWRFQSTSDLAKQA